MSARIRVVDSVISGLVRTFSVELDASEIDARLKSELERLSRTARVPGFRAGKAPMHVLRGHFEARLTRQLVDQLAILAARDIISDHGLRPVSRPKIGAFTKLDGGKVQFQLAVEVFPDIVLQPLSDLRVERLTADPDQKRIERVRERQPHGAGMSAEVTVAQALNRLSRLHLKRQVLDWLASCYDFEVPQTMMEKELSRIRSHHIEQIGGRVDAALEERYREIAQRRIRLAIVLLELGKAYSVPVPTTDIEHLVRRDGARDEEHNATLIDFYLRHPTALAELQSPQLEDSVVDAILSRAEVTDRTVSADELVAAAGLDILDLA